MKKSLLFLTFLAFWISCSVSLAPPPGVIFKIHPLNSPSPADVKIYLKINEDELPEKTQKKLTDTLAVFFFLSWQAQDDYYTSITSYTRDSISRNSYRITSSSWTTMDSSSEWFNKDELKRGIYREYSGLIAGNYEVSVAILNSSGKEVIHIIKDFKVSYLQGNTRKE